MFDPLRLQHGAAVCLGPAVHREQAVCIGGGGDDGDRPAGSGQLCGKVVCPAQVAGQQRDGEPPALIQHDDGRVGGFAAAVGRNGPDGDARRPHEDERLAPGELRRRPIGKGDPPLPCPAAGDGAGQRFCKAAGQRKAFFRKGQIGTSHGWASCAAGRNSVAKAGS